MMIILWIGTVVLAECGLAMLVGRFLSLSNPRHGEAQRGRRRDLRPSRVIYRHPRTGSLPRPATSPGSW